MQISTIHKAKLIKFAETLIKIIIVLLGCWFLYKKSSVIPILQTLKIPLLNLLPEEERLLS